MAGHSTITGSPIRAYTREAHLKYFAQTNSLLPQPSQASTQLNPSSTPEASPTIKDATSDLSKKEVIPELEEEQKADCNLSQLENQVELLRNEKLNLLQEIEQKDKIISTIKTSNKWQMSQKPKQAASADHKSMKERRFKEMQMYQAEKIREIEHRIDLARERMQKSQKQRSLRAQQCQGVRINPLHYLKEEDDSRNSVILVPHFTQITRQPQANLDSEGQSCLIYPGSDGKYGLPKTSAQEKASESFENILAKYKLSLQKDSQKKQSEADNEDNYSALTRAARTPLDSQLPQQSNARTISHYNSNIANIVMNTNHIHSGYLSSPRDSSDFTKELNIFGEHYKSLKPSKQSFLIWIGN